MGSTTLVGDQDPPNELLKDIVSTQGPTPRNSNSVSPRRNQELAFFTNLLLHVTLMWVSKARTFRKTALQIFQVCSLNPPSLHPRSSLEGSRDSKVRGHTWLSSAQNRP